MSNTNLVTIIIPYFNRTDLAIRAIQSALKQTYEHLEIIVVDDGSTDKSLSTSSKLSAPNLKFIRHENNRGANAARNTGLNNANGFWVAFLDSDDTWHPKKIETMLSFVGHQKKYDFLYCSMEMMKNDKVHFIHRAKEYSEVYHSLLKKNIIGSSSVPIIKKTVLQDVGGFDEKLESGQDWDLWLRIAEKNYSFKAIELPLVKYTLPENDSHISGSVDLFLKGRERFIQKHKNKYIEPYRNLLSQIYSDTGFLLLKRFQKNNKARIWFLKALQIKWSFLKPWKGLVASLLPEIFRKKIL